MTDAAPVSAARERLLADHEPTLRAVVACADAVAAGWEGTVEGRPATADRDRVVGPMRTVLARADVLDRLPGLLADAVDAAGYTLQASPVAAPPYVVVTSIGPVMRATVADGRLVVECRTFRLERGDQTRYVRVGSEPDDVLSVTLR